MKAVIEGSRAICEAATGPQGRNANPLPDPEVAYQLESWPRRWFLGFYSVRDRAGIPDVRLHDLRRTCITLLLGWGDLGNMLG